MPSERSSLLSLQRRQKQQLEEQQLQLQMERQKRERLYRNSRPHTYLPRGAAGNDRLRYSQNQSIDFLTDDNVPANIVPPHRLDDRGPFKDRKESDACGDLIQLDYNENHPNNEDDSGMITNNTTRNVKELQLRAAGRTRNRGYKNDVFQSINGAIEHPNLEEERQIEVLNSFDEDDDNVTENSTRKNDNNDLLGLGIIDGMGAAGGGEDSTMKPREFVSNAMRKMKNETSDWMDGTFYVNNNIMNENNGQRKISGQTIQQTTNQKNHAKKAILNLFGTPFNNNEKNQETTMSNIPSLTNDNFGLAGNEEVHTNNNRINDSDRKSMTNSLSNSHRQKHLRQKNKSSSLLDQVVERPPLSTTPSKSEAYRKRSNEKVNDSDSQTAMKTIRSPLQISSSSLDPDLFMPSQQQHYLPNLSEISSNAYNRSTHGPSNSQMTFRHSSIGNNNLGKNPNNVDTARSWFGGNLNTNTGSTMQSSTLIDVTSSSSTVASTSSNEEMKKNPYMHVIGSSQNQSLPTKFDQNTTGTDNNIISSYATQKKNHETNHWNWLNISLFLSYGFTTAANTVPITLIPTIAMDVLQQSRDINEGDNNDDQSSSIDGMVSKFASVVATYVALGIAFGKFLNGSLGDIFGARRVACYFSLLHSFTLFMLSFCVKEWSVVYCCVAIEYYQSVQWPCIAVILATHYGNGILGENGNNKKFGPNSPVNDEKIDVQIQNNTSNTDGKYEKGIYIASLGSRGGALFASLATTMFLRYGGMGWRGVTRLASFGSFLGFVIMYLFVTDSPKKLHDPQNPIKEDIPEIRHLSTFTLYRLRNNMITIKDVTNGFQAFAKLVVIVFSRNVLPSLRSVLSNVTFWVVAIAHSGGLMVCSSIRILGTYFRDTSYGVISENQAGFVSLFLSVGVLVGLLVGGNIFGDLSNNPQARKSMVSKLYILTVAMCYTLSFLAVPIVRNAINSHYLIAFLQAAATLVMGAGVAVQVYCIPAIVGCTFGANKGLYASYTDGVAYTVSSLVWHIMGNAVEEGNPEGAGWAYGWAAVALLVVLAGCLMVEFVEHYFCRGGWIGRLRDAEARARYDRDSEMERTFDEESSVSRLAESGKRIWEKGHALFRPTSSAKQREPDMNSILSIDDDDDDVSTILFENISSMTGSEFGKVEDLTPPDALSAQISKLLMCDCNKTCVDCGAPFPRWVSIIVPNKDPSSLEYFDKKQGVGAFCCSQCAGSHRKLGTHLAFVRSVDHDNFTADEVRALEQGGNTFVNRSYEAYLSGNDPLKITPDSSLIEREKFIFAKYANKSWYQYTVQSNFNTSLEIELVDGMSSPMKFDHDKKESPSSVVECAPTSVFDQMAPVNQETIRHYESFVMNGSDSQSEISNHQNLIENVSISSEESDAWQISGEQRGLDVYVDL